MNTSTDQIVTRLKDLSERGVGFDMNPTMMFTTAESMYSQWLGYFTRLDQTWRGYVGEIAVAQADHTANTARLEYTIVAETSNGTLSQIADHTTVVREHLIGLLETYQTEEERLEGDPDRIFIAERPIPKWVRS